jgi:hypothetical protein
MFFRKITASKNNVITVLPQVTVTTYYINMNLCMLALQRHFLYLYGVTDILLLLQNPIQGAVPNERPYGKTH